MGYTPPFTITSKSINLIAEISAVLERVKINVEKANSLILNSLKSYIKQNDTVNDTVNLILKLMKENPLISYDEIARKLGKSRATISRKIAELKERGIIKRIGADKNGKWQVLAGEEK